MKGKHEMRGATPLTNLILLLILLLITVSPLIANAAAIHPTGNIFPLSGHVEIFHDPAGSVNIDQLLRGNELHKFKPNTRAIANFGYIHGQLWLRFSINGDDAAGRYLLSDQPIGGRVAIYPVTQGGKLMPEYAQPVRNYRAPAWKLQIPTGETATIYLRASNGNEVLRMPLYLLTNDAFIQRGLRDYLLSGMVMAGLLILMLYNLVLAMGVRERGYFYLAVFIGSLLIILNRDSNLFPALAFVNDTTSWFYPTALVAVLLAGLHYMWHVSRNENDTLSHLLKWLRLGTALTLAVAWLLPTSLIYGFTQVLLPVLAMLLLYAAWRGSTPWRQTWVAMIIFLATASVYVLTHTGWVTSAETNRLFVQIGQAGSLLAVLALSIAQASDGRRLLEQVERERTRNQVKDQFLTTISHELRTPMNAVTATTTLLRQTPLNDEQREYLSRQEIASRHMLTLIDDFLDLSRLQSNTLSLNEECFFLPRLLDDLNGMIVADAESRGLSLRLSCDDVRQYCLIGDRRRLHQVLLNLLFNAIKFTPEGAVTLQVTGQPDPDNAKHINCRFDVTDSGIGIDPEMQQQIFEPFSQAQSERSRTHGGAGLGLSICRQLVTLMGGNLALKSTPGQGSRFYFTLSFPTCSCSPPQKLDDEARAAPAVSLRGRRLLIVEDDSLNRFFLQKILNKEGVDVVAAEDGKSALKILGEQDDIELVLMDISMPEMDGYETTRRIHAEPKLADLPVIALTAHAITGERERCLAAGMCEYLTKPIDVDALRRTVAVWLPPAENHARD